MPSIKLLLSVVLLSFVFAGCEGGYSWQVAPDPYSYPTTNVEQFRENGGFYFPAGTHVYQFITCLNLSGTTDLDVGEGDWQTVLYECSPTPYTRNSDYVLQVLTVTKNDGLSIYTFEFDSQKGILKDEVFPAAVKAIRDEKKQMVFCAIDEFVDIPQCLAL